METVAAEEKSKLAMYVSIAISIATVMISATQVYIAHQNNINRIEIEKINNVRSILSESAEKLGAVRDGIVDIDMRLIGITSLGLITTEDPPTEYLISACNLLESYIKFNLPKRKKDKIGHVGTRSQVRPADIVAALKTLQSIRQASKGKIEVKLRGLDFNEVDLGYVDLEGFNLSHSQFNNAIIGRNLRNVNFDHADLTKVAIWNADMSHSTFHKAILTAAKFQNVNLTGTNIEEAEKKDTANFTVAGLSNKQATLFKNYKKIVPP